MNVAIIIPELGGGGAERAAQTLGNCLVKRGHNVCFFLFDSISPVIFKPKCEILYINISEYRRLLWGTDESEFRSALRKAAKIVSSVKKKKKIDISISFMEESNFLNVKSCIGEKVIISIRTTLSERDELFGFFYQKDYIKKIYNRAFCIVACSEFVKKDLIDNYALNKKRVIVIPNVSMNHDTREMNEKWKYGKKAVLSVARISKEKQHDHLIRAFKYVHDLCEESELLILGDGPLKNYMQWYADKLGVGDSVHFLGFVENVGYYMQNSRVFVMTSKTEGFPNSMVEAMSYGLPIVTTDSPGGCREIVSDDTNPVRALGNFADISCSMRSRPAPRIEISFPHCGQCGGINTVLPHM